MPGTDLKPRNYLRMIVRLRTRALREEALQRVPDPFREWVRLYLNDRLARQRAKALAGKLPPGITLDAWMDVHDEPEY